MSGVRTGTRLEQLYALRDRIALEIRAEERRLSLQRPAFEVFKKPRPKHTTELRLEQLGLTSRQVKEWAHATGLVDEVKRGRIGADLVNAYADAHRGGTA
jgi:hypothetical protein